ncbi:MAG: hypothetical protein M4579_002530 [Chaenotheca gracillima]|nr:MAG: hypothetical protein M4579_002530 [Chaenotheca gracillima]
MDYSATTFPGADRFAPSPGSDYGFVSPSVNLSAPNVSTTSMVVNSKGKGKDESSPAIALNVPVRSARPLTTSRSSSVLNKLYEIQRMFGKGKSARQEDIPPVPNMNLSKLALTEPSPNTHPLLSKPHPREEIVLDINDRAKTHSKNGTESWSFDISKWGAYLKYYGEGRLSVSNPPVPPPLGDFVYFRAPIPPNEQGRTEFFKQIDGLLTTDAIARLDQLVDIGCRMLLTRQASLSFVHDVEEVLLVERGYNRRTIPRSESLAAHCVFSTEPMILLDAQKDWRFQRNPLVLYGPKIRFYAGAPLITREGKIIGVFAVFDPVYRVSLPYAGQRALTDLAKIAMTGIELLLESSTSQKVNYAKIAADKLLGIMTEEMESIDELRGRTRLQSSPTDSQSPGFKQDQSMTSSPRVSPKLERKASRDAFGYHSPVKNEPVGTHQPGEHTQHHNLKRSRGLTTVHETSRRLLDQVSKPTTSPSSSKSIKAEPGTEADPAVMDMLDMFPLPPTHLPNRLVAAGPLIKDKGVTRDQNGERSSGSNQRHLPPSIAANPTSPRGKAFASDCLTDDTRELDMVLRAIARKYQFDILYAVRIRANEALDLVVHPADTALRALGRYGMERHFVLWQPFHLECLRQNKALIRNNPNWNSNKEQPNLMWRQSIIAPVAHFRISTNSSVNIPGVTDTEQYASLRARRAPVAGVVIAAFSDHARPSNDYTQSDLDNLVSETALIKRISRRIVLNDGTKAHADLTESAPVSAFSHYAPQIAAGRVAPRGHPGPTTPPTKARPSKSTATPRIKSEPSEDHIGVAVTSPAGAANSLSASADQDIFF